MIVTQTVLSPSEYIERITGVQQECLGKLSCAEIMEVLRSYDINKLKSYTLIETATAIKQGGNIALVECKVYNPVKKKFELEVRWFETLPF